MTVFVDITGHGPNLTLLHGWGLNGAVWNSIRDELRKHFTLHIIDLPGHGRSQGAAVSTLDAFADAVLHAMPPKGHVMGWSLGGHTALSIAHRAPARIDKLITVCSTPRFVAAADWPNGKEGAVLADFASRLSNNFGPTIRNFLALQALHQPDRREVIRALNTAVEAHGAPNVQSLSASLEILRTSDIRALVPSIHIPTLVMQGDHDALTSTASGEWLAAHLPHGKLQMMPRAAHAPFLSHPTEFLVHVLSFLRS